MERVDKQKRYHQIREILLGKTMTAKEVAVEMMRRGFTPTDERNFASPRIHELEEFGEIERIGKKKCEYTGKSVWIYGMKEVQL